MRTIMIIVLCGVAALAGLILARTAASEGTLTISTVEDSTTATIGDQTVTVPPAITVIERNPPPDMSLTRFKERRYTLIHKIRGIQRFKAFRHRAHPSRMAREIKPWRRSEVLSGWHRRLDRVHDRNGKWFSKWAYYRIPSSVRSDFLCIHGGEGAWNDPNDPYWGGLQMDRSFMSSYGYRALRRYGGYANVWPARVQIIVADIARRSGRGYYPWPRTARACGLI